MHQESLRGRVYPPTPEVLGKGWALSSSSSSEILGLGLGWRRRKRSRLRTEQEVAVGVPTPGGGQIRLSPGDETPKQNGLGPMEGDCAAEHRTDGASSVQCLCPISVSEREAPRRSGPCVSPPSAAMHLTIRVVTCPHNLQ